MPIDDTYSIRIMQSKQQTALQGLTKLGKQVALKARPTHYSFENIEQAKAFAAMLPALRDAYVRVRNGQDPRTQLVGLCNVVQSGTERNLLEKLISRII